MSVLDDKVFLGEIRELVRLVDGLESGMVTCACRRVYKVGVAKELREILPRIKLELEERLSSPTPPGDSSSFVLIRD